MTIKIETFNDGCQFIKGDTFSEQYQVNKYYFVKDLSNLSISAHDLYSLFPRLTVFSATIIQMFTRNLPKFYDIGELGITDGYWLVLLSPFVLIYWILFSFAIIPIYIILGLLIAVAFIWGFLFELPADVLNKKKLNILIAKYEAEHPESIKEEVKEK
jgi:uncharacterized membrane protein YjgN (DUF898 family)